MFGLDLTCPFLALYKDNGMLQMKDYTKKRIAAIFISLTRLSKK